MFYQDPETICPILAVYVSLRAALINVEKGAQLWVAQEALDVTVLTGGSVQLLFIDDDPLQKTFFHQAVQSTHDQKKFAFRIQYLMDFLGATWANRIDYLEKLKFLITYPNVVFISRHGWFMI
jgi:hypothetical protein